ncbi:DUF3887 domain-containing protein [Chlorogloeopsis sp. ULAP02]|uniref:DUF3887 domain-containing protein n=1 Tax=Chlorogloeopsis sp. ULAP02 TaxID=3107926 RepID=UPI00398AC910
MIIPAQCKEIGQLAQLLDSSSAQVSKVQSVTEQFVTSLAEQKFEQARENFSPSLQAAWSPKNLQQQWQKLVKITGPLVKVDNIRPVPGVDNYTVVVTASFKDSKEDFLVILDRNLQITAVNFLWLGNIQTNAEEFVNAISSGNYGMARTYLAPSLKKKLLPETIKQQWQNLLVTTGPFKKQLGSKVVKGGNNDVVLVNLEFEKFKGSFMVVFDGLGRIMGVDFPSKKT